MRRLGTRSALATLLVAVVSVGAVGCTQSSGSRHTLYDNVDSLARDSSAIVVGSVTDQRQDTSAGFTTTISTVEVANDPENPSLGANLDGGPVQLVVGDVIQVRQDGEPSVLHPGQEYLLFVTASMLPGDAAAHFFITGAVAGAYQREGNQYTRVRTDSGDNLPDTIQIAGTDGLIGSSP
jgi:hypothetical protein